MLRLRPQRPLRKVQRPTFDRQKAHQFILPDTGLAKEVESRLVGTKMDCLYDELSLLDELVTAWWSSKFRVYEDERCDFTLAKAMADDEFDLSLAVESMFDNMDDELMDRDMVFYEENEICHRLTDLSYRVQELIPLMNKTFNVVLLSGVDLNGVSFVGIEKAGIHPVMYVE